MRAQRTGSCWKNSSVASIFLYPNPSLPHFVGGSSCHGCNTNQPRVGSTLGFALELRCVAELSQAGFLVEHGGSYDDPALNKPRQFDLRCMFVAGSRIAKLAIECKAISAELPLVILRTKRTRRESFHELICSAQPPPQAMPGHKIVEIHRTRSGSRLYPQDGFVGKSSLQIGEKDGRTIVHDKEIYEKWSQAISSSRDLVTASAGDYLRTRSTPSHAFVLPVLVVPDGCLWHVDYAESGGRASDPAQLDDVDFYIGKEYEIPGGPISPWIYSLSHLKVVTLSGLRSVVGRLVGKDGPMWDAIFSEPTDFCRI